MGAHVGWKKKSKEHTGIQLKWYSIRLEQKVIFISGYPSNIHKVLKCQRVVVLLVVHKEGLKVVVFVFTEYLKEENRLKLEGDEIGLKQLTETNGVKGRFLMLEFVAIIYCQISVNTKKIFEKNEINILFWSHERFLFLIFFILFQWFTLLMKFWFFFIR